MDKNKAILGLLLLLFFSPLWADDMPSIVVDLADPVYENGILTTENGGVLTAPDLRIQAQKITYIQQVDKDPPIFTVACSGDLLIDYKEWTLRGESFYYDFNANKGFLINGRTASPPWFIGGREFLFLENGDLHVLDGFVTTSEGEVEDVVLRSSNIVLSADRFLSAKDVSLRINEIPIFWLPYIALDLNEIDSSPFAVRYGWGGFLGSYVSLLYRFLTWRDFKAIARLDAFFGKGVGFGIETAYKPSYRATQLYTRSYYAHDISLANPTRRDRYRFQGTFCDCIRGFVLNGIYDFVSDAEMATEYTPKDFDLKTAGRTHFEIRRKEPKWIASLFTQVRVNDFQSVNQELPSFYVQLHPLQIPSTGIIFENTFKASYLNYVFSDDVQNREDFSSGRLCVHPLLYRPFIFGPVTMTPEAGLIGIAYSNSPAGGSRVASLGELGVKMESALFQTYQGWKHVIEPYVHYSFLTQPSVSPDNHFIFTINDGWNRLNLIRLGIRNSFFMKQPCEIVRSLWFDLWTNAYLNTPTVPQTIPKGYFNIEWMPHPRIFMGVDGAWHFAEKQIDFYNTRIDWTLTEWFALGIEYRHRSRFDWRKADFYNFILESTRPENKLLDSPLSDQRDTLLFRFFARLSPEWAAKFDLRQGWRNRKFQSPYLEYKVELSRIIFQHWKLAVSYEKRKRDHRSSFSITMQPGPP